MRKIFLEKSYTKCGGVIILRLFSKKSNNLKFKQFFAIVCQIEGYQNILKLSCRSLAFTSCKAFSIKKRGLEIVSLTHFLHGF